MTKEQTLMSYVPFFMRKQIIFTKSKPHIFTQNKFIFRNDSNTIIIAYISIITKWKN